MRTNVKTEITLPDKLAIELPEPALIERLPVIHGDGFPEANL
jgi:hypothetical protein